MQQIRDMGGGRVAAATAAAAAPLAIGHACAHAGAGHCPSRPSHWSELPGAHLAS
jgi:hypothetical protein